MSLYEDSLNDVCSHGSVNLSSRFHLRLFQIAGYVIWRSSSTVSHSCLLLTEELSGGGGELNSKEERSSYIATIISIDNKTKQNKFAASISSKADGSSSHYAVRRQLKAKI